ncbi:alanine--tRNA ligase [Spirobacillus cienkowskii]|uniref:alanine--tRNA ligase n=1 Tax=Spirobacillus cienkowskii TaxID=495820 RepID=UPI0030CC7B09
MIKTTFGQWGPQALRGPCSELYLDQGEHVGSCAEQGKTCAGPGCDCDRFLEFWNLVFMQYNRQEDGTLHDLPMKSVDTGCGLERLTALIQGKTSNFDIDIFLRIKQKILDISGHTQKLAELSKQELESFNVIADHIRLLTFTVADGAHFSNEGRGYVLRRVLRRAVRHIHKIAPNWPKNKSFLAQLVQTVIKEMGEFYPEIATNQKRIEDAIFAEELRFNSTLDIGLAKFHAFIEDTKNKHKKVLSGENVFILHDSYGFPADLTQILCQELGFQADLDSFKNYMQEQKQRSRTEAKFYKFDLDDSPWIEFNPANQEKDKSFSGYFLQATTIKENHDVIELPINFSQIKKVRQLKNKFFEFVIENTPFYPEGGGQVADNGWIAVQAANSKNEFEVIDVRKTASQIVHLLKHIEWSSDSAAPLSSTEILNLFGQNSKVTAFVDLTLRTATMRNHTATHLLHKALQIVLGDSVRQAGSFVHSEGLRFDFSYNKALSNQEIKTIEGIVNKQILKNINIKVHESVPLSTAKEMGAMAMFDEKYEDHVRMLEVPEFSLELCGGTHVFATGQIGLFKIISEGSVTSGVRRIEGITGFNSLEFCNKLQNQILLTAEAIKCAESEIVNKIHSMKENSKELEKQIHILQSRIVNTQIASLVANAIDLGNNIKLVINLLETNDTKEMELLCDRLKEKPATIAVIAANIENKAHLMVAINPSLIKQYKKLSAGQIVKQLSEIVEGKGGGRPDFARGGGINPEKIPVALKKVVEIIQLAI